jgi:hypothetical protein
MAVIANRYLLRKGEDSGSIYQISLQRAGLATPSDRVNNMMTLPVIANKKAQAAALGSTHKSRKSLQ